MALAIARRCGLLQVNSLAFCLILGATGDDFGVQLLVNYRNGRQRFPTLWLKDINDIEVGKVNPDALRDVLGGRIVLIGVTAPSIKDFIDTSAIASLQPPGKIYGVEFHARICQPNC